MPNIKSAKKRLRQDRVRRLRNRSVKASLKTAVKRTRDAVAGGDLAKAEEMLRAAAKRFDQAAAKGVIHKNAASRTKSRLSALIRQKKQPANATA